ncbi:CAAX farnesyltransferase (FTase) subunit beta, partial [Massospora cicadina]
DEVMKLLFKFIGNKGIDWERFRRESHISYLVDGLESLPEGYTGLVASQPWLCFWILQSLAILGYAFSPQLCQRVVETISRLQNATGGFGGGAGQVSHLATTYAAVHSLFIVGGERAYAVIDREKLYTWFLSLKQGDGSFRMCHGGEIDIRATYCVLACASLLNLVTPELVSGMGAFIAKCQSFDGGLGCYPGSESHGGYTYCGLAALALLQEGGRVAVDSVARWAVDRQLLKEGGFQGRTNKLVDGCYSFWVGAVFPILSSFMAADPVELYDRDALKTYIVLACQSPAGGLRDKPGKPSDYYHTCYVLSGLSISQHSYKVNPPEGGPGLSLGMAGYYWVATPYSSPKSVPEADGCLMLPTHPLFNIPMSKVMEAYAHFYEL